MNGHKTAITRNKPSRPTLGAIKANLVNGKVLDYGCGKGKDVEHLKALGFDVTGFDPFFNPIIIEGSYDTILCNYVLNVIPSIWDRISVVEKAFYNLKVGGILIISVRNRKDIEANKTKSWKPANDGYITAKGTFQSGLEAHDLVSYFKQSTFANHGTVQVINNSVYSVVVITRTKF